MKKKNLLALLFTSLLLFLAACGPALPEQNTAGSEDVTADLPTSDGESLVIGMTNAPAEMNPFYAQGTSSQWAQRFIYESLVDMVAPSVFESRLGEITTEDNQVFTIKMNADAYWSDGIPVSADDLAYTINTIAHPDVLTSKGAKILMIEGTDESGKSLDGGELSGVRIIDEKTVEIKTKTPLDINYFMEIFGRDVMIAPKHVFSEIPYEEIHTSEAANQPTVTNGAYKYVEYKEEDYLHLAANPDYYQGAPKINEVFIRVVNATNFPSELQAGNIQMLTAGGFGNITHEDAVLLEDTEHLVIEPMPSTIVQYMMFNTENERYADPRVRRALGHALNLDIAIENLLLGNGEVSPGPYTSASAYIHPTLEPLSYDQELAKSLLEEAGFDFNEPITLAVPTGNLLREQMGDLIEQWLEQIGLTVNQERFDFTTHISNSRNGDYEINLMGMAHTYDPDISHFMGTGGGSNYPQYSDEKMDSLLQQGREATDPEERRAIYNELQEYFQEQSPAIPLYSENEYKVQDKKLKGGIDEFQLGATANIHEWELTE